MRLFVGDDWAEDHHDVELMDAAGRVLARKRLPEGVAGMVRLHALIGEQLGEDAEDAEVVIGTQTDRGPWVAALVAAGYTVYGVNPPASVGVPSAARRVGRQERRRRRAHAGRHGADRFPSAAGGRWRVTARTSARSRWWHGPIRR